MTTKWIYLMILQRYSLLLSVIIIYCSDQFYISEALFSFLLFFLTIYVPSFRMAHKIYLRMQLKGKTVHSVPRMEVLLQLAPSLLLLAL